MSVFRRTCSDFSIGCVCSCQVLKKSGLTMFKHHHVIICTLLVHMAGTYTGTYGEIYQDNDSYLKEGQSFSDETVSLSKAENQKQLMEEALKFSLEKKGYGRQPLIDYLVYLAKLLDRPHQFNVPINHEMPDKYMMRRRYSWTDFPQAYRQRSENDNYHYGRISPQEEGLYLPYKSLKYFKQNELVFPVKSYSMENNTVQDKLEFPVKPYSMENNKKYCLVLRRMGFFLTHCSFLENGSEGTCPKTEPCGIIIHPFWSLPKKCYSSFDCSQDNICCDHACYTHKICQEPARRNDINVNINVNVRVYNKEAEESSSTAGPIYDRTDKIETESYPTPEPVHCRNCEVSEEADKSYATTDPTYSTNLDNNKGAEKSNSPTESSTNYYEVNVETGSGFYDIDDDDIYYEIL